MNISIVGIGMGSLDLLIAKAIKTIEDSSLLIGHKRMLKPFEYVNCEKREAYLSNDIKSIIESEDIGKVSILVSGDVGFFSASKKLLKVLKSYSVELIPGISSIVYFSSKIGLNWEDMNILSLHGRDLSILGSISRNEKTFLLTGGENTVEKVLHELYKIKDILVYIGENLSYENEKITIGEVKELIKKSFSDLSVMVIENKNVLENCIYRNIPDSEFTRGKVPMTKSEVRNIVIGKLRLKENDILYDIGAGTGSVSIEASQLLIYGSVYAIEKNPNAVELINHNKEEFKAYNVKVIEGEAPEKLKELKAPNKVFIGGSSGKLESIMKAVLIKNPNVRIVVTCVSLETITEAFKVFNKLKISNTEIVQVGVSRAKGLGEYNMMIAENPIYIFSGDGKCE